MDPETSGGNVTSMKKVGVRDMFLHQLHHTDSSESLVDHLLGVR